MITCAAFTLALGIGPVNAASFDCDAEALKADEQVICDTRALNDMDVKMVTTFELLSGLMAMGNRGQLQDQQIEWLTKRGECKADIGCLTAAYATRLAELTTIYDGIERPK
ncbi:hypothetical protein HGO38_19400 [Rhizobium sp. CG5]|uniref:lysozyme inhibitor LprI family protein n=1 Tax=Rhizobium sp. CG5 TaxID=2726076 RepID=UPI00203489C7|nr:hypothetical protein [Rhizobium sp. CG5]MCM2475644.1 hypothetical protein [Rhizobium sp. CG5]